MMSDTIQHIRESGEFWHREKPVFVLNTSLCRAYDIITDSIEQITEVEKKRRTPGIQNKAQSRRRHSIQSLKRLIKVNSLKRRSSSDSRTRKISFLPDPYEHSCEVSQVNLEHGE